MNKIIKEKSKLGNKKKCFNKIISNRLKTYIRFECRNQIFCLYETQALN